MTTMVGTMVRTVHLCEPRVSRSPRPTAAARSARRRPRGAARRGPMPHLPADWPPRLARRATRRRWPCRSYFCRRESSNAMVFVSCDRSNSDGSRFGTKDTPRGPSSKPSRHRTCRRPGTPSRSSRRGLPRVAARSGSAEGVPPYFCVVVVLLARHENVAVLGSYATPSSPPLCLTGSSSRALSWYASPVGWNGASYTMTRCPGIGSFYPPLAHGHEEAFRNFTPSESHADASMLSRLSTHPDVEANGSY